MHFSREVLPGQHGCTVATNYGHTKAAGVHIIYIMLLDDMCGSMNTTSGRTFLLPRCALTVLLECLRREIKKFNYKQPNRPNETPHWRRMGFCCEMKWNEPTLLPPPMKAIIDNKHET